MRKQRAVGQPVDLDGFGEARSQMRGKTPEKAVQQPDFCADNMRSLPKNGGRSIAANLTAGH